VHMLDFLANSCIFFLDQLLKLFFKGLNHNNLLLLQLLAVP
jgi:hypothetical protein